MSKRRPRRNGRPSVADQEIHQTVAPIAIDIGRPLLMPNGERWIFNITKARQLIRATLRRELHSFSGQEIAQLLQRFQLPKADVDAADPRIPGIAAVIPYGGQRALQIIEGAERACKAFATQRPFPLYVLSDAERDRCLWSRTGLKGIGEMLMGGEAKSDE